MHKLYTLLIFCLFLSKANAQWITIPDANFVTFLQQNYPSCMNGNQMDTTCSAIVNENYLDCGYKNISDLTGIQYFDNLQYLICKYNQLTFLPDLPANLIELDCSDNQLNLFPDLPLNLEHFDCSFNPIQMLPFLPFSLKVLKIQSNPLVGQIYSIQLPSGLLELWATGQPLISLPPLPNMLQILYLNGSLISTLPNLPSSLIEFGIGSVNLSSLPPLPPNLNFLYVHSAPITSLPNLPNSLGYLSLRGCNNLTVLPILPPSLYYLDFEYTSIACLPPLNNITSLYFNNTNIQCVPAYYPNINSSPPLSAFPLCNSSLNVQINSQHTSLCDTNLIMIEADTGSGFIYQWQLNGNNIQGAVSNSFQATLPGNYRVIVMSACMIDTSNVISIITGIPNATINALGPTTFCSGGYVTLKANTGTGLSYQWNFNGTVISGANSSTYFATIPGIYSVLISNVCGATNSNTISINTIDPPPALVSIFGPKTVCPSTIHFFSVTSVAGATNYNWTVPPQASIISGQGTNAITVSFANIGGNVTVSSENQCGASNPVILNVNLKACYQSNDDIMKNSLISVDKFNLDLEIFNIYPNPSNGKFDLVYLLPQNKEGVVEVFDINGKVVYEMTLLQLSTLQQIRLPSYISSGLYNCVITSEGYRKSKKVAVIKE